MRLGSVSLQVSKAVVGLDHFTLGATPIIRSIFATVRDHNWSTIQPRVMRQDLSTTADGFDLKIEADCTPGGAPVTYTFEAVGRSDLIKVRFLGLVHAPFKRNRVGLCVLHPWSLAGTPVRLTHIDGTSSTSIFPPLISPHQPFKNLRAMRHESGGRHVTIEFAGEVFETEDQRNWTDASYKTYCTPLDQPFPIELQPGAIIDQSITVSLAKIKTRPSIGVMINDAPADASHVETLKSIGVDHVRIDLDLSSDWRPTFERAIRLAQHINAKPTVAAMGVYAENVKGLVEALNPTAQWLLAMGENRRSPSIDAVRALRAANYSGAIAFGSDANFTELNRASSSIDPLLVDGLFFAANPQVHAFDEESILETPFGLEACVTSARWLLWGKPVLVSPLTMRRRFNAVATSGSGSLDDVDPRQNGEFASDWIDAAILAASRAGASLVTTFEAFGPRGVVDTSGRLTPAGRSLKRILSEESS